MYVCMCVYNTVYIYIYIVCILYCEWDCKPCGFCCTELTGDTWRHCTQVWDIRGTPKLHRSANPLGKQHGPKGMGRAMLITVLTRWPQEARQQE